MAFGSEAEDWRCLAKHGMGLAVTFGSGMGVAVDWTTGGAAKVTER